MTEFSRRILSWFKHHGRVLPWRGIRDPYATLVAEVMLQQTRVETVIPFFNRWMVRYPSIADLAAASEQDLLGLWEGLGYYNRVRNLHRAVKIIVDQYEGELPRDLSALRSLPGIGRYTAGAIASIAFGMDVAALDGNIRRVLARAFDVRQRADSPKGEKVLWALAEENLPRGRSGDYNQALMDLGAMICLPRDPDCGNCPLGKLCRARALGVQRQRPVMKPRLAGLHYMVTAAIIRRRGKVLLAKRPSPGLLGGLWEFPGGKVEEGETLEMSLRREILEELGAEISVGEPFGVYRHAYTHFRITLHAFLCDLTAGEPESIQAAALAWVFPVDLGDYPMGKVDRQIARKLTNAGPG